VRRTAVALDIDILEELYRFHQALLSASLLERDLVAEIGYPCIEAEHRVVKLVVGRFEKLFKVPNPFYFIP
jgi:hypothetical protein